jgi:radical SAM superfamily enzyme YgiQ (UPF0313 family)
MEVVLLTACVTNHNILYRPIGAYQVAWYLRKFGYNVQVLDFLHRFDEQTIMRMVSRYINKETKIVGYGAMIGLKDPESKEFINKIEKILRKIKKNFPWVNLVAGGAAAADLNRMFRNKTLFDYIFFGHAEDTMLALANNLVRNGPGVQFEKLEGNRIIRESFVMPHAEKFNIEEDTHTWHENDFVQPGETLPIELGRGCIFKCRFCQYPYIGKHKKDFNRCMDLVKAEMIRNYEKWQVTNYYMLDDTFNADEERVEEFSKMVSTLPFKIHYATYLRLDLIAAHPQTEDMLLESGLMGAYFGIETFNEEAATLIGKPWNGKKAKKYLPELHHNKWKKQVAFRAGFICGLPPETFEDCLETNKWCLDNEIPNWYWHPLHINRNNYSEFISEFDKNSEKYGFEWIVDNGVVLWKTATCDQRTASTWKHKLMQQAQPHQKNAQWNLLELANYGVDIQEAKNILIQDMDWGHINRKRNQFLTNYLKQVLSQP